MASLLKLGVSSTRGSTNTGENQYGSSVGFRGVTFVGSTSSSPPNIALDRPNRNPFPNDIHIVLSNLTVLGAAI